MDIQVRRKMVIITAAMMTRYKERELKNAFRLEYLNIQMIFIDKKYLGLKKKLKDTWIDLKTYIKEFLHIRRSSLDVHALNSSLLVREYVLNDRAFLWFRDLSYDSKSSPSSSGQDGIPWIF